jgi:hypothetical protein
MCIVRLIHTFTVTNVTFQESVETCQYFDAVSNGKAHTHIHTHTHTQFAPSNTVSGCFLTLQRLTIYKDVAQ